MTTTTHRDARFPNRSPRFPTANMISSSFIILGLRAAQMLFAIIVMGLTAYVAHWYNVDTLTSSPSQINWLLAVSVFTIISVLYLELTPRFAPKLSHQLVAVGLEACNALFYFAGFIALSVFMSRLLFCRGSVCGAAQASIAFGAMEFLLWTVSAILVGKEVSKSGLGLSLPLPKFRRNNGSSKGPLSVPPMKEAPQAA
ncbi:membrane-associating domain-containing protein [Annulohypoxylon maeteangense]|uniref:membrane-associating domain-containing protein n=1 Tax=Annulohypoxylon maeteangense TaxID=1927788 RepID=UPI002007B892|nr:membrane-associating domain-containing protein [Annulohypoxylon maeteangense]KAI0882428.1 membrane-associating domain-containing protein [Annulohypoxylon maeteangense]